MTDTDSIKVSAIICTYNRYYSLLKSIASIQKQTHSNIEIIIVNDKSEEKKYYNYNRPHASNIKWIDLSISSVEKFGFPSLGYTRNVGIAEAKGEYIAFLDDDDIWMPEKIKLQLEAVLENNSSMSCTEAYIGDSVYKKKNYPLYYAEYYKEFCRTFFEQNYGTWNGALPKIFNSALIKKHNFIIHSSVMIKRSLLNKVGNYNNIPFGGEDWDLWNRLLTHTDCVYITNPLVYYDGRIFRHKLHRRILQKIKNILVKDPHHRVLSMNLQQNK